MYEFSDDVYLEVAERLMQAIGRKEFFSGAVTYYDDEVCCRLKISAVVHRTKTNNPEPQMSVEARVVPVWWEMTTTIGNEEVLNDFSFREMMALIS